MNESEKLGLKINDTQAKEMHFSRRQNENRGPLKIDGLEFEKLDYFIFLGGTNVISEIKSRRIIWVWHILNNEEGCVLKEVLKGNLEGRRPRGRPQKLWWNQVKTGLKKVVATEEDVEDRFRWRGYVDVARYQLGYRLPLEQTCTGPRATRCIKPSPRALMSPRFLCPPHEGPSFRRPCAVKGKEKGGERYREEISR
ncbi:hypothetical protein J437_LFUL012508 [Ladona fulva]|uniref:Uncharacterized protein n=1 Tax=Ladona fulva TaxID=123851 RepID=A0A8K0K183_LADFU|nr:hypothetical protein J437_LFUL012508 [Ladona fulva]